MSSSSSSTATYSSRIIGKIWSSATERQNAYRARKMNVESFGSSLSERATMTASGSASENVAPAHNLTRNVGGRPRVYNTAAERQRAYRDRKKLASSNSSDGQLTFENAAVTVTVTAATLQINPNAEKNGTCIDAVELHIPHVALVANAAATKNRGPNGALADVAVTNNEETLTAGAKKRGPKSKADNPTTAVGAITIPVPKKREPNPITDSEAALLIIKQSKNKKSKNNTQRHEELEKESYLGDL